MKDKVAIIGKGITGLLAASKLSKLGKDVTLFYCAKTPTASRRNHAWLQSGQLYPHDPAAAILIGANRNRLINYANIRIPKSKKGIFRVSSEASAKEAIAWAKRNNFEKVSNVGEDLAFESLGPFYSPGGAHILVPDCPFPEEEILDFAEKEARSLHTNFVELTNNAELIDTPKGAAILADGETYEFESIFIAAGAGIPKILHGIGELGKFPIHVFRSPLLKMNNIPELKSELFVDRTCHLSLLRHLEDKTHRSTCIVIGNGMKVKVEDPLCIPDLRVTKEEKESLISLTKDIMDKVEHNKLEFIACLKPEKLIDGKASRIPYIFTSNKYKNVVFGLCGKATLGLYTAEQMVNKIYPNRDEIIKPTATKHYVNNNMWYQQSKII